MRFLTIYNQTKTMKKFSWMMMLMAAMTLSFVSCDEPIDDSNNPNEKPDDGNEKPGDENPVELTFNVEVSEVTSSSVSYSVTPSDLEAEYLVVLYDKASADEFTRDQYLVSALYQELEEEAGSMGKTFAEYMPEFVDKGAINGTFDRLAPETEYYIIVFGVDASKNYAATTGLNKTLVTTEAVVLLDVTFDIETIVDGNYAEYVVTPSDPEAIWYFYTIEKNTYDYYTSAEGYDMTPIDFILFCLQYQIEQLQGAGYADIDILNILFHKGALTLEAEGLTANTEYVNIVAAFDVKETGEISIISDVTTTTYTTGNAKQKDLTFDISVTDVESNRAAIKITPSNNNDTFCWLVAEWDGVQTAEEIMNHTVESYGGWMSMMANYKGVQDYTGGPGSPYKYKLNAPDTDYYVIAFGYAGGITSEPEMVTFRTLPAPDPATTEFTMTASNIAPYGFDITLTASHATTYYTLGICTPEEYDEALFIEEANAGFDELYAAYKQFDPNTTIAQVLSQYWSGNITTTASGMNPETTIMGYVFAFDNKTGHVTKAHVFNPLATTTKLGAITPTVEVVGYYSGDEENGSVFGKPAATAGKSITVVKYGNLDGARSLFVTSLIGDCSNSVGYPDAELWGTCAGYWKTCKLATPYTFYVTSWNEDLTAVAYATDSEGLPGGLGRVLTRATAAEKGKIEDLKALVEELNAAESKSLAMPKSLVVGEQPAVKSASKPVLAPVAESVVETQAMPTFELNSNMVMQLDYIRPFYIRK